MDQFTKKLKEKEKEFEKLKAAQKEDDTEIENSKEKPQGLPDRDFKRNLGCG
ncbi:MAG: hypothetical protein NXI20_09270 [bacterium]|nr:hypothetical protein [bacterium]